MSANSSLMLIGSISLVVLVLWMFIAGQDLSSIAKPPKWFNLLVSTSGLMSFGLAIASLATSKITSDHSSESQQRLFAVFVVAHVLNAVYSLVVWQKIHKESRQKRAQKRAIKRNERQRNKYNFV